MCIICIDFQKQLLTLSEARKNLSEMIVDRVHLQEINEMLDKAENQDD